MSDTLKMLNKSTNVSERERNTDAAPFITEDWSDRNVHALGGGDGLKYTVVPVGEAIYERAYDGGAGGEGGYQHQAPVNQTLGIARVTDARYRNQTNPKPHTRPNQRTVPDRVWPLAPDLLNRGFGYLTARAVDSQNQNIRRHCFHQTLNRGSATIDETNFIAR